ncbi:hypothetical protein C7M71_000075 [Peterkaempfera bronchialis]|uniref:Helicase ATP-binding domain-containing protein n=1 Tax=Peterkaempfera bronchialis TaxID=2126346 RepID=A0A345SQW2_9ACTN|nr:hypothetical protein C7M71_000075 [Peterkaempfera bronchialis]
MPHKPIRLRPHQQRAVSAITAGLQRHSRVTVVAACGTGKTVIARASADTYTPHGNILVLAPSQDLVAQTAREWDCGRPDEKHIAVCALPPSGRGALCIPFTTSPAELARRVADHSGPTIVFSTYQSLPAIVEAHRRHGLPEWALAVADEAHHTTGSLDKSWGDIHDDAQIPAQRRLYMTATPRRWSHPKSRKPGAYKQPLASMDNPGSHRSLLERSDAAAAPGLDPGRSRRHLSLHAPLRSRPGHSCRTGPDGEDRRRRERRGRHGERPRTVHGTDSVAAPPTGRRHHGR